MLAAAHLDRHAGRQARHGHGLTQTIMPALLRQGRQPGEVRRHTTSSASSPDHRAPASKAGEGILAHDGINDAQPRGLWQYLVGQRRVRKRAVGGLRHAGLGDLRHRPVRRGLQPVRPDRPARAQADRQEGAVHPLQQQPRRRGQGGRPGDAATPQPGPGALGAAPRVGGRGHAGRRQAPRGAQAHATTSTRTPGRSSCSTARTPRANSGAPTTR